MKHKWNNQLHSFDDIINHLKLFEVKSEGVRTLGDKHKIVMTFISAVGKALYMKKEHYPDFEVVAVLCGGERYFDMAWDDVVYATHLHFSTEGEEKGFWVERKHCPVSTNKHHTESKVHGSVLLINFLQKILVWTFEKGLIGDVQDLIR